jgi:hypothetical protein
VVTGCQAATHPETGTVQVISPDAPPEVVAAWAQDMCDRRGTMHLTTECECGCATSWLVCWPCTVAIIRQLRGTRKPARCTRCSVADIPGGRPHVCPVVVTIEGDPVPAPAGAR